jgi:hypothetical protein
VLSPQILASIPLMRSSIIVLLEGVVLLEYYCVLVEKLAGVYMLASGDYGIAPILKHSIMDLSLMIATYAKVCTTADKPCGTHKPEVLSETAPLIRKAILIVKNYT